MYLMSKHLGEPYEFAIQKLKYHLSLKTNQTSGHTYVLSIKIHEFNKTTIYLDESLTYSILQEFKERLTTHIVEDSQLIYRGQGEYIAFFDSGLQVRQWEEYIKSCLESLSKPYLIRNRKFYLNIFVGVAVYPLHSRQPDELIKKSYLAMQSITNPFGKRIQFADQRTLSRFEEDFVLEQDLLSALENKELSLFYQPQMHLKDNKLLGFEALLRWFHPEKGLISPDRFIPLAEKNGLIIPIGDWVVNKALEQIQVWNRNAKISINLSIVQIKSEDFLPKLYHAIRRSPVNPNLIELEITESVTAEMDDLYPVIRDIRKLGINIAIDDFGTGYSSLWYLEQLPVNTLKIDRIFIKSINSEKPSAVLDMIMNMGKQLPLNLIAEGVETLEQYRYLLNMDCYAAQGYYFTPPRPPELLKPFF